ncbi:MAG: hypothetical protein ABJN36_17005 [Cyclobacteriaceae bacterium]
MDILAYTYMAMGSAIIANKVAPIAVKKSPEVLPVIFRIVRFETKKEISTQNNYQ